MLASVLAHRYGVEVRIGSDCAKTDGKTIYLPAMPPDLDRETLDIAKGYVDHESAHIRHTDFELLRKENLDVPTKWLFNAIEDWRVENRLVEIFPGCRHNFHNLILKILGGEEDTRAGRENPALDILEYVLLSVRLWDVPELAAKRQKIHDKVERYFQGLCVNLDKILVKVRRNCPDTNAAIDYARELIACINQWQTSCEEKQDSSEKTKNTSSSNQRKNSTTTMRRPGKNSAPMGQINISTELQTNSVPSQICEANCSILSASEQLQQLLASEDMDFPSNVGEILGKTLESQSVPGEDGGIIVATEHLKEVYALTETQKKDAMRCCNSMKQRLSGLLMSQSICRKVTGRRGRLQTRKLFRLITGNPKIFQKSIKHDALDTAVHILLDCSMSMRGKQITLACEVCYSVAMALQGINGINIGITAFPAGYVENSVSPIIRHGQRMSGGFLVDAAGDTPLAPALWWVILNMRQLKVTRRMILILTDGVPNSRKATEDAIKQAQKLGIEIYGIGIMDSSIGDFLPNTSMTIRSIDELAPTMFEILKNSLVWRNMP